MYDIFVINTGVPGNTWKNIKSRFPHARLVNDKNWLLYCADQSYTKAFWVVPSDIIIDDQFDFSYRLKDWDTDYVHVWPSKEIDSDTICDITVHEPLSLWPRKLVIEKDGDYKRIISESGNIKEFHEPVFSLARYDLFLIVHDDRADDSHLDSFKKRYPHARPIMSATDVFYRCSQLSRTAMFWTIDSNVEISEDWNFTYRPTVWENMYLHVWPTKNPTNGAVNDTISQESVKLWPKNGKIEFKNSWLDIVQSDGIIKLMDTCVGSVSPYDIFFADENGESSLRWKAFSTRFPNAKLVQASQAIAYHVCASKTATDLFWLVGSEVNVKDGWDFSYRLPTWDRKYIHIWPSWDEHGHARYDIDAYDSVALLPRSISKTAGKWADIVSMDGNIKIMNEHIGTCAPYDIFFVSYEEPNADENWEQVQKRFKNAKRVHGIKGIAEAHRHCASLSTTDMFWTIDGDTVVNQDWDFSYRPPRWHKKYLHLWYSKNPVTGMCYGYGSIKLWSKSAVMAHKKPWLDFSTSFEDIKVVEKTVSETRFNSTPFEAWKSSFRECVKLLENIVVNQRDIDSKIRLNSWVNLSSESAENAKWCKKGAEDAISWHESNRHMLSTINDFSWLKNKFTSENF